MIADPHALGDPAIDPDAGQPVDLSAVAADAEVLDRLAAGVALDGPTRLLAQWRAEVDTGLDAASATITEAVLRVVLP